MDNDLKTLIKGRPFLKIYLDVFALDGMSFLDVMIISYIIYFNINENKCYLSSNDFRWAFNVSKRAVEKSFKRLKDLGYLEIVHQKHGLKQEKRLTQAFLDKVWKPIPKEAENETQRQIEALRQKLKIRPRD